MEKRTFFTKKRSVLLAAALLALSSGVAAAKSRDHRAVAPYGASITDDASSTNVEAATRGLGYAAPHEVPENGGAAMMVQPGYAPNWR
jgi:hypothetical protein